MRCLPILRRSRRWPINARSVPLRRCSNAFGEVRVSSRSPTDGTLHWRFDMAAQAAALWIIYDLHRQTEPRGMAMRGSLHTLAWGCAGILAVSGPSGTVHAQLLHPMFQDHAVL